MDVNAFFKRAMDIISSALGLIVLSPVLLVIAAAIKLHDGGSVFYRASRVGRYGAEFKLYKFRSMVANADKLGPAVTGAADKRITPIGRFLRKTKLDELPQLINVLTGDMSLVGPRPESPKYVAYYTDEQRHVLDVRPGITSPASVAYRHEEAMLRGDDWEQFYIDEVMPAKLAIDLAYVEKASVLQDFRIIWKTFRALFENEAA
jgi:lipopolysaccharide/colanic/teichoic acid biosynthesis glycosyltransferase